MHSGPSYGFTTQVARRGIRAARLVVSLTLGSLPVTARAQDTTVTSSAVVAMAGGDTVSGTAGARAITLRDAVALARQNNPANVQARGTERSARAAVRSANGAFLPNVSVSAGAVRRFDGNRSTSFTNPNGTITTGSNGNWTYSNGFSFSAELFNFANFPNARAARADVTAARATEVAQEYAVALDVAQQYYNALSARESEDAARAQLAQAREQLAASVRRVLAGAATRSDSLRSFVQVASARVALLTATTNLRSANAALSRLIGSSEIVTATPSDSAAVSTGQALDSASVIGLALQGPAVAQARAALNAAEQRKSAAKASYLPTVTAGYSRSGNGSDVGFGLGNDAFAYNGQFSLGLSYSIFNGFAREEQNVRAKVARENAVAGLRDSELAARQLGVQYWDALRAAREQVVAQTAAVVAAEEDLRVQRARYDLGVSTLVDVLTSQTQLNQARADLITARYNARLAAARIESLFGRELTASSLSTVR